MVWSMTHFGDDGTRRPRDERVAQRLAATIGGREKLPVLDKALQRVLALADREETTVGELVTEVEHNAALTANVLRYVNSAAVSVVMPVRTVRQAVALVGRTGVRRLALESTAFRFFERASGNGGASCGQMHLHAIQVARLAAACAEHAGIGTDAPHLAGLLHDCGKQVMPDAFGVEEMDELAAHHPAGGERARAELERFGVDHAQAGALFAAASGVGEEVVRAIAWHHGGDQGLVAPDRVSACVQLADVVAHAIADLPLDRDLCEAALSTLGLPDEVLDELAEEAGLPEVDRPSLLARRVRELERLSQTDDLTGLASRRHWLQHVRGRLEAGEAGGVVLLDIDAFKSINDTHGHHAGDVVLCEVARIAGGLGFAGRLGGDELAIWVAHEPSAVAAIAEQVVAATRREPVLPATGSLTVTVSAGTAVTMGELQLSELLSRADEALYRAKRTGRNRVVCADASLAG